MFGSYHRALVTDAQRPRSAVERIMVMNVRTIPWVAPAALAVAVCWWFSLDGVRSLWVSLPLVGVTLVGLIYVGYVYTVVGWRSDRERGRKAGTWR